MNASPGQKYPLRSLDVNLTNVECKTTPLYHAHMLVLPNKREILQSLLDKIDPRWEIIKPSPLNPTDPDFLCIFRKDLERQKVEIPNPWYQEQGGREKIEHVLRNLLK